MSKRATTNNPYPKNWEQITGDTAVSIAPSVLSGDTASKIKILESLMPPEVLPVFTTLTPRQIYAQFRHINWLFDTPLTQSHIPSFTINGTRYVLPNQKFENVNLIEYSYASRFYGEFTDKKSYNALNKVIASLCRPEKQGLDTLSPEYDGDPRERFSPQLIESRAADMDLLPFEFKCYFIIYFNSCSNAIVKQFKPLFDSANTEGGTKSPNFGWLGVMYALADAQVFGNFEQVQFTNIYTALGYRLKKYYEAKELDRR